MIPAFLIWLYNRYAAAAARKRAKKNQTNVFQNTVSRIFVPLLFLWSSASAGKETTATYRVIHNGYVIGQALFQHRVEGVETFLKISSQVSTRFVFGIQINTVDEARFKSGKLLSSSVYRKVNGKERETRKTIWIDHCYQMQAGARTKIANHPIYYNMMLLYCQEPSNQTAIYSDNFQQFLHIKKIASHVYQVNLPDGNHNIYHFQNGICNLIEIHHSLYTIKMELI